MWIGFESIHFCRSVLVKRRFLPSLRHHRAPIAIAIGHRLVNELCRLVDVHKRVSRGYPERFQTPPRESTTATPLPLKSPRDERRHPEQLELDDSAAELFFLIHS